MFGATFQQSLMNSKPWLKYLALAFFCALSLVVQAEPLHLLLTNDDGYDAPGIKTLHLALNDAGFRVTVVAPREQQSGSSMRVTMGQVRVEKIAEAFWTVAGTPADAVSYALTTVMRDDPPALVVSGTNFGQNLGGNTNLSGTVGAALMANQLGIPAIAVSVGIHLSEAKIEPQRFPSTMTAFPEAAAFMVNLIKQLVASQRNGAPLLPENIALNVNYPALHSSKIKGARMALVARTGGFIPQFVATDDPSMMRIDLAHADPGPENMPLGDSALFSEGYITISALDGRLGALLAHDHAALAARLQALIAR